MAEPEQRLTALREAALDVEASLEADVGYPSRCRQSKWEPRSSRSSSPHPGLCI